MPLTAQDRLRVREAKSAKVRAEANAQAGPSPGTLTGTCLELAQGDSWLALNLALEGTRERMRQDGTLEARVRRATSG